MFNYTSFQHPTIVKKILAGINRAMTTGDEIPVYNRKGKLSFYVVPDTSGKFYFVSADWENFITESVVKAFNRSGKSGLMTLVKRFQVE